MPKNLFSREVWCARIKKLSNNDEDPAQYRKNVPKGEETRKNGGAIEEQQKIEHREKD
jgi:hypothetical protein